MKQGKFEIVVGTLYIMIEIKYLPHWFQESHTRTGSGVSRVTSTKTFGPTPEISSMW